jgi:L-lysine exporter family protein LysE/ArgO
MLFGFAMGFALGLSLIVAIGAQNAFILRQGILRQHVFVLCLICAVSDAVLIAIGVAGVGAIISNSPNLLMAIRLGGAAFLLWYAFVAIRRAIYPEGLEANAEAGADLKTAIGTCLAFTFLNPHVYVDTVLLVGASAPHEGNARSAYALGAMLASFVWFFALGFGARLLEPIFKNPRAWQILDTMIAVIMLLIAFGLVYPLLA